jgi:predicted AlkP superfamily pyrophosphatase or phosphodiesterase
MRHILLALLLSGYISAPAIAAPADSHESPPITHVIYITLDGVRWQDVFLNHSYLATFWHKYADTGVMYGAPGSHTTMETGSVPTSLPSYQSQMAGSVQPCKDNECGRIRVETLAETLIHKKHWQKQDVAIFSNWEKIDEAVQHKPGTVYISTGNMPVYDPLTNQPDEVMTKVNREQALEHRNDKDRYDKTTFAQAMHYLTKYQPHFMWISLGDGDEYAHDGKLAQYHQTLRFYDKAIDQLFTTLATLGLAKETMVIITTDHGRANGVNWTSHGVEYPESKRSWAFVTNGDLKPVSIDNNIRHYSTLSVRPTVESAFGI